MSLLRFIIAFVLLLIISTGAILLLENYTSPKIILIPNFWLVYIYMAGITLLVYFLSFIGLKLAGENQPLILLGGVFIRLLGSLGFVLVYLNKTKVDPILFVVNFFSVYFLFTVFEIYCLLRNLRHQIKK